MIKKICYKCKLEKDYCDFGKLKSSTDGLRYECKSCRKNHRINNIEKIKGQELNRRIINRDELNLKQKEYRKVYHEELKIKRTEYRLKNKGKINKYSQIYKEKNPEKVRSWKLLNPNYHNSYRKKRLKEDVLFRIICSSRSRINKYLKNKSKSTFEIIGLSSEELKLYLQNRFTPGMSWDNYGINGWHIDHSIPLSSAKTEEEIYKLCHYTNLQPLWAKDNLTKGSKLFLL